MGYIGVIIPIPGTCQYQKPAEGRDTFSHPLFVVAQNPGKNPHYRQVLLDDLWGESDDMYSTFLVENTLQSLVGTVP